MDNFTKVANKAKQAMQSYIALAHDIKWNTDASDPIEIREAVAMLAPCKMSNGLDDMTITLNGCDWRFIREDAIDAIMQDALSADDYILGCFADWFLADVLDVDIDVVQAMQKAEAFEALGKLVLSTGKLQELQEKYVQADGYGHHFAHYDHDESNLSTQPYYAFKIG